MSIFRYRPLSEFLFKELFYQEIYLAIYAELNDPLDLNTLLDFTIKEQKQVNSLSHFIFRRSIVNSLTKEDFKGSRSLIDFVNNKEKFEKFAKRFFDDLLKTQEGKDFISIEVITDVLFTMEMEFQLSFELDRDFIINEIQRLTKKFFQNSYTACFSETNNDFLMWSHYATKHTGICLEFAIEEVTNSKLHFPLEFSLPEDGTNKFEKFTYTQEMNKVLYKPIRHFANFYDFLPIFNNEHDCDVIGLSKSNWHPYANRIKEMFCVKTEPWLYEKEWRMVSVNFEKCSDPEERIMHYPTDSLIAVYFGMRTPLEVKNRIYNIYRHKRKDILFFESILTNGRNLEFVKWVYQEDDEY